MKNALDKSAFCSAVINPLTISRIRDKSSLSLTQAAAPSSLGATSANCISLRNVSRASARAFNGGTAGRQRLGLTVEETEPC